MIFRNSIRNGKEFYDQWRKSHIMTSWKDCTNLEYESLRNTRPFWNCTIWRFTRRKLDLTITDWRQWWKEVSSRIYELRILRPETEIMRQTPWSRIRGQQREQRTLGDCWQWKANGQCSKGDDCSFRHDINKRAKTTQPNPSPSSSPSSKEMHREPEVPEAKSQWKDVSIALQGSPQRNLHQFILWQMASSRMLVLQVGEWMQIWEKSALMRIARLMNSLAKGLQRMVTKVQRLCWKLHDNCVAYFKIWSRRSLQRFCGRAQTHGNQSDVLTSQKPSFVMRTFETKIHRLEWFARWSSSA